MLEFLQQIVNGVSLGSIYALIALGYTMVYGILRFINFAHGDVFMMGAFAGLFLTPVILPIVGGQSLLAGPLVMIGAMLGCGLLGILIERFAYRPLRNRPTITVLITAIGVSFFLEYFGQLSFIFGPNPRPFPELIPNEYIPVMAGLSISITDVIVTGTAIVLMLVLRFVVMNTKMGTAMRAISYNLQASRLMGINIDRVVSFTFALGSVLAAAAAILFASKYPKVEPLMGIYPGLKAFVAAVLGGIGNLVGAALGGFIIGLTETFVAGYVSPTFKDAIVFGILILILLFRPSGLLGTSQSEKV